MNTPDQCSDCKHNRNGFCSIGDRDAAEFIALPVNKGGCGPNAVKKNIDEMERQPRTSPTVYREPYSWR